MAPEGVGGMSVAGSVALAPHIPQARARAQAQAQLPVPGSASVSVAVPEKVPAPAQAHDTVLARLGAVRALLGDGRSATLWGERMKEAMLRSWGGGEGGVGAGWRPEVLAEVEREGRAAWSELAGQFRSEFASATKGVVELLAEMEWVQGERARTEAENERLRNELKALRGGATLTDKAGQQERPSVVLPWSGPDAPPPTDDGRACDTSLEAAAKEGARDAGGERGADDGRPTAEEFEALLEQNEALEVACAERDEQLRQLVQASQAAVRHERRRLAEYRERMLYSAATRWVCNDLSRAFATLRMAAASARRQRQVLARSVAGWRQGLLTRVFRAWCSAGQAVRRRGQAVAFALRLRRQRASLDSHFMLLAAFASLREAKGRHAAARARSRRASALASAHLLRAVLLPWAGHVRRNLAKATNFRARRDARHTMGFVFGAWAVLAATGEAGFGGSSPSPGASPRSISGEPFDGVGRAQGGSFHVSLQRSELMVGGRPTAQERRVHILMEGQIKALFIECGLSVLVEDSREVARLHAAVQSSLKKGDTSTALRARFDVLRYGCTRATAQLAALKLAVEDAKGEEGRLAESVHALTEELRSTREEGNLSLANALERATQAEEAYEALSRAWEEDERKRATAAFAQKGTALPVSSPRHRSVEEWEHLVQGREDLFELARARLLEAHLEQLTAMRVANGASLGQWYASMKQSLAQVQPGSPEAMQLLQRSAQELVLPAESFTLGPKAMVIAVRYLHRIWDMIITERDNPVRFRVAASQTDSPAGADVPSAAAVAAATRRPGADSNRVAADWYPGALHSALQRTRGGSEGTWAAPAGPAASPLQSTSRPQTPASSAPSAKPSMPPVRLSSAASATIRMQAPVALPPRSLSAARSVLTSVPTTVSLVVPPEHAHAYRTSEISPRPSSVARGPAPPRLVVAHQHAMFRD